MRQNTGNVLVTRPARPLGSVVFCPCGRTNDSGRERECPDCERPVRGMSGFTGRGDFDLQPLYRAEAEALSATAAYGLGLFVAHDVREEAAR